MSSALAPSAKAMLAPILAAYETAQLGELTRTADALRLVCQRLGWIDARDGPMRLWALAQVEGEPK